MPKQQFPKYLRSPGEGWLTRVYLPQTLVTFLKSAIIFEHGCECARCGKPFTAKSRSSACVVPKVGREARLGSIVQAWRLGTIRTDYLTVCRRCARGAREWWATRQVP